jgi:amino acid transporter
MGTDPEFSRNRVTGWTSLAVGVGVGLVMGLWSFDGPLRPPAWIGEYGDTSRRLVRLGHIAFIGLGLIDILIERELVRSALGHRSRAIASWAMVIGNVILPITLFVSAVFLPFKYFMGVPAGAVFLALVLTAYGARSHAPSPTPHASRPTPHAPRPKPLESRQ